MAAAFAISAVGAPVSAAKPTEPGCHARIVGLQLDQDTTGASKPGFGNRYKEAGIGRGDANKYIKYLCSPINA